MSETNYREWWEGEIRRRGEVELILDRVLGPDEEDGAGEGFVADVALAISRAWQQGYAAAVSAPANRAFGLGNPVNPYANLLDPPDRPADQGPRQDAGGSL